MQLRESWPRNPASNAENCAQTAVCATFCRVSLPFVTRVPLFHSIPIARVGGGGLGTRTRERIHWSASSFGPGSSFFAVSDSTLTFASRIRSLHPLTSSQNNESECNEKIHVLPLLRLCPLVPGTSFHHGKLGIFDNGDIQFSVLMSVSSLILV